MVMVPRFPEDEAQKPFEPERVTATAFIEEDDKVTGAYFLKHDNTYQTQHCFHIVRRTLY